MTQPRIKRITIEGHTSMKRARVELGPLNVLVGANGSGKSNFVRALELLGRIADRELALYVGLAGGASALLRQPGGYLTRIVVESDDVTYTAWLAATADDQLIFEHEAASSGRQRNVGLPGSRESTIAEARDGPQPALYGPKVYIPEILFSAVDLLRGCRVFHFHDTSSHAAVKQPGPTADNLRLAADAHNLAAMLFALADTDRPTYDRIVRAVRQVAPFFRDFVLLPDKHDQIRLRWRQSDSDTVFSAHQMSDGTLRFICLATLLLQPELPGLIVLDEPELGLHPFAIVALADMLRAAATQRQVVIATQSVTLIDQFALDDLIVVERKSGESTFDRPAPEPLRQWLDEYSLGELWQKNLIGGRPNRDSE